MNPIFLEIGPIQIYWYSVFVLLGFLLGGYLAIKEAKRFEISKEFMVNMFFYLVPIVIIGARLYYVIFNFSLFKDNLLDIFKVWEGGLAIYGAVIACIIFIISYCKKKEKNILLTLDTLAPYLILGQAIGRWGNFINKEAHGALTTYEYLKSMHLPNFIIEGMYINGAYYIPTFLYESIWCLLGFIILMIIKKKNKFKRTIF